MNNDLDVIVSFLKENNLKLSDIKAVNTAKFVKIMHKTTMSNKPEDREMFAKIGAQEISDARICRTEPDSICDNIRLATKDGSYYAGYYELLDALAGAES